MAPTPRSSTGLPARSLAGDSRKLDQVNRVKDLFNLPFPRGIILKDPPAAVAGGASMRINDRCRLCSRWEAGDAYEVEITDYQLESYSNTGTSQWWSSVRRRLPRG